MHPFTNVRRESVGALGEVGLIASIRGWLGPATPPSPFGIGDDCAVLPPSKRHQLITVDPVIFERHFDAKLNPRAVGAKLLKRNLSDIAAMGGRPQSAVVALTLDPRTKIEWVRGFYRGLAATAMRFGVAIVGGDVAQADRVLAASLTLIGAATTERVLTRTGGRIGDYIYVTGALGNSLASGHHHRFTPRLSEGAWLVRQPAVRSMIDISDGLAKDVLALAPPGGYPAIRPESLPLRRGAMVRAALTDGEDYELLLTIARNCDRVRFERAWCAMFPRVAMTCIGELVRAPRVPGAASAIGSGKQLPGQTGAVDLNQFHGYEHLR